MNLGAQKSIINKKKSSGKRKEWIKRLINICKQRVHMRANTVKYLVIYKAIRGNKEGFVEKA